ncbi:hypothetical protein PRIPAC_85762 [Pristionchus pacificus]|uniref:Uncharacterized protein n=1 Tax=Pristionchus pacificus TaxID=54126 RepID=A0A454XXI6_PRIPA|nr:hypothetical protein PRIPAC_85762 [Pristionchus pacificus]|eukprot:PDM74834.1 hypothetical protein PRIPAC_43324 [Pristionchus pacificus]
MEARYKIELRERDPAKIDQLYLDNCQCDKIEGLSDNLASLDTLSMVNCGLKTLEGLPILPELVIFDISQNELDGGLEILADKCPKLEKLVLSDNKFVTMEQLEPLKALTSLSVLDTFQNDVEDTDDYRTKIFEMLPTLKDLNGHDINGEVTEECEEEETGGEDGEDSDGGDSSDEDDGPGLAYLQNSHILDDEDETEDFEAVEGDDDEEGADGAANTRRGVKRRHEGGDDEESNQ